MMPAAFAPERWSNGVTHRDPLRVLQVVLSLAPGGTERLVVELVKRSAPAVSCTVCCLDEQGDWAAELTGSGISVVALGRRPGFRPWLGLRIAALARKQRATVLHCHHYSPFVYGRLATYLNPRLKLVFTEHGRLSDGPPDAKRRAANGVLAGRSVAACAVSPALRRHLLAEGFSPEQVQVVPNGIEPGLAPTAQERLEARIRLSLRLDDLVIGTVARLDPLKDLGTLIRAFAILRASVPTSALVIVGDGPDRGSLRAIANETGCANAIRFVGHRSDARRLLPAFDVYANSSITEGIALTILEAMAATLPVVATDVGGTPEVIDSTTGALVPARNPEAMARAILELARAPFSARCKGRAARRRVLERFTIDRMVATYMRLYGAQGDV